MTVSRVWWTPSRILSSTVPILSFILLKNDDILGVAKRAGAEVQAELQRCFSQITLRHSLVR
jgi:hypothetical protein